MKQFLPVINSLAIIAIVIHLLASQPAESPAEPINAPALEVQQSSAAQTDLNFAVRTLQAALQEETLQRQRLESELLALRKQLPTTAQAISEESQSEDPEATAIPEVAETISLAEQRRGLFTQFGLDAARIDAIEAKAEKMEMDQLYLRNRAVREGWFGSERYFQESRKLESNGNVYREELGDELYDRYLFEAGMSNRVSVANVISASPAEKAGLQSGDVIFSYDNQRIFQWSDLTSATAEGAPGENVRVEVVRNGQRLEVYLPRGPIGIRLDAIKSQP